MGEPRLLYLLAVTRGTGRCRDCKQPIEWGVSAPHGSNVPLNPHPLVLRVFENANGVKFEVVSMSDLHFTTCQHKRDRRGATSRPRTGSRARL